MRKVLAMACIIIFAIVLTLTGCNFSVSTANVKDAHMTTAMGDDGKPVDTVDTYAPDAKLVAVAILHNAPEDTKVKFIWYYGTEKVYEYPLDTQGKSEVYISCTLTPSQTLQTGDYKVEIYVDERDKPDATATFTVK